MSWVAVMVAGGAIIQGVTSDQASKKQAGAGKDALRLQGDIYNANKGELDPFRNVGVQGLGALQQGLGIGTGFGADYTMGGFNPNAPLLKPFSLADFQQSPAYQFNLQQGQMAIDKGANARGNLYAPQTLQDLSKFSQGLASNEFQNAFNNYRANQSDQFSRLFQTSEQGRGAASALAGVGTQFAGMMGDTIQGIGNARAAGDVGIGNAINGGLGDIINMYQQKQWLDALRNNQSVYERNMP